MGLGKTVQATVALRVLAAAGELGEALVVVPAGLVAQWQQALRRWAPDLAVSTVRGPVAERAWQWRVPAQVRLVGYDTLRSDVTDNPSCPPRGRIWDVVVLDEAQRVKNRDTATARACKRLPRRRAWSLTGTPLENRVEDLLSVLEFTRPWTDGRPSAALPPGATLRQRQAEVQLRRRRHDVLAELPPKRVVEIPLELGGAQRESYLRAERLGIVRLAALGRDVRVAHVLELITRLKQICNVCPATGTSAKLDDLEARLEELSCQGHRALVFSQYTSADHGVGAIAARCARLRPLVYTGAQSLHERDEVVERFRADPRHRLLALSLRAGGLGLNLQQASYVVHFDRWWNPAVERQAEDRCHRMGQRLPVTVYAYRCVGTIEDRIQAILAEKQALFDTLVDGVSLSVDSLLTKEELFGLFAMPVPSR
jgi:SNF2 family DNA or RNA helicase